jgi:hypothetical protein
VECGICEADALQVLRRLDFIVMAGFFVHHVACAAS